jgi:hypothetical protein
MDEITGNYKQPLDAEKGGQHVAGLGCVGVLGTPALRRNNGERE